jgi:sugar lactone lactonase YvrE
MPTPEARYIAAPATTAEGWNLSRLTPPSRLYGANGIRIGRDGRIYVAQVCGSQVSAVDPDSGDIAVISPMGGGITAPDDLAFDSAGNLYCTEITANRLSVLHPDGTTRVLNGNVPVANPVTVFQNRVIAGEMRMGAQIREFDRSTGEARVILDNVPMPNAFEVGPDGKLYFPAQGANEIWRVSLDGGEPEVVARDLGIPDSVKFDAQGFIVSTQVGSGEVLRIDPRTGAREVLAQLMPGLDNCAILGDRVFVSHITGGLWELGGGTAKPVIEPRFQWPMGIGIDADGTVLAADGMFAHTIPAGGQMTWAGCLFDGRFPGFSRGLAATADGQWLVTTANSVVVKWSLGGVPEVMAAGFDCPMGVTEGPGGEAVFADYLSGRIMAASGGEARELAGGLDRPMGVALGADGTAYVAESGKGRVVKLVGGKAECVVDALGEPQGIAVHGGKLYVLDTGAKQIVEADLVSGAQRVLASGLPVGAPTGVAPIRLGGVGEFCGPRVAMAGIAVAADGTVVFAADGEGSVMALRPS